MSQTLFVGIDVASQTFAYQLMGETGEPLGKVNTLPNTPQGAQSLEEHLVSVLTQGGYGQLKIGLEATAFYDWHLADYLAASKELNQAIAQELAAFPNTLTTLPGVGPVLAAGILAEIGNIQCFASDEQVAKLAGLVWKRHPSGKFEAQDRPMVASANKYLRYYLVEAANALRMHEASYRAFYEAKFKEVPKHQHKRALVLTARKLVRLVFALLKRGQIYRPVAVQPAGREHVV